MVLQRGVRFPVWGWTTPGSRVRVEMRGKEETAVADAQGRWTAKLGPFDAGGPFTLTVEGAQTLTLTDVLVGDVWLASGQSNMEMGVTQVNDAEEEVSRANYPRIRLFQVPKVAATTPRSTVNARWLVCTPKNIAEGGWGGFSAVAYFFGRRLHEELNVPVGLIHSSWGGTAAEGWISAEKLSTMPEFVPTVNDLEKAWADSKRPPENFDGALAEWWAKNDPGSAASPSWSEPSFDASAWKTMRLPQYFEDGGLPGFDGVVWFRKTFELPDAWAGKDLTLGLGPVDDVDTTFVNGFAVGGLSQWDAPRSYRVSARLLKPGTNTVAVRVFDGGVGGGIYGRPESMKIEPAGGGATPVSLAGEWSYRASVALSEIKTEPPRSGGNDFSVPEIRYNGMIAPLLPFAVKGAIWYQGETNVGRAPQYERVMAALIRDWRERFTSGGGDFPFLVVQLANHLERRDAPDDSEWARLREAQLHVSRDVKNSGLAVTIDIGDAKDIHPKNKQDVGARLALVALANVYGRGLEYSGPVYKSMKVEGGRVRIFFGHAAGGLEARGGRLKGFAVAGDDGRFRWADATVEGDTVIVSSREVKRPAAVRYGWADNPDCNLYNRAGLPASPFRTDDYAAGTPRP
jgi:sialate O-acetylesterase